MGFTVIDERGDEKRVVPEHEQGGSVRLGAVGPVSAACQHVPTTSTWIASVRRALV